VIKAAGPFSLGCYLQYVGNVLTPCFGCLCVEDVLSADNTIHISAYLYLVSSSSSRSWVCMMLVLSMLIVLADVKIDTHKTYESNNPTTLRKR
jgi:hypothetical protein